MNTTGFCSRRLLDCAEDADAEGFDAFMEQVGSKKQPKFTHTFARRDALKTILAQREQLRECSARSAGTDSAGTNRQGTRMRDRRMLACAHASLSYDSCKLP